MNIKSVVFEFKGQVFNMNVQDMKLFFTQLGYLLPICENKTVWNQEKAPTLEVR